MHLVRPLSVAALALAVLSGCGDKKDDPADTVPSPTGTASGSSSPGAPSTSSTATSAGSTPTSTTSTGTSTGTSTPCTTSRAVPEGTWEGPLTLDVQGTGGTAKFADTPGTGSLRLVVAHGKVTDATWSVDWTSEGHASSGKAKATIKVAGSLSGTATGTAARPVLDGDWLIKGSASITVGAQTSSAPVDQTGPQKSPLKIRRADCTEVTASFSVDFTSTDAAAIFTGKGAWVAKPVS
jgi:hypothetical protein